MIKIPPENGLTDPPLKELKYLQMGLIPMLRKTTHPILHFYIKCLVDVVEELMIERK